jgi:hypothetical protein
MARESCEEDRVTRPPTFFAVRNRAARAQVRYSAFDPLTTFLLVGGKLFATALQVQQEDSDGPIRIFANNSVVT